MNQDLNLIVHDTEMELEKIREWINKNPFDFKVSYLNSFAVIKASGTLELVLKTMLFEKLSENANEETTCYLNKMILESSFNPTTGKILNILQDLSSSWKTSFESYLTNKAQEKSNLNSLVQQRNSFSHGGTINMSIEIIIRYFKSGVEIMENLFQIINKKDSVI